jgi:hypothetical protein
MISQPIALHIGENWLIGEVMRCGKGIKKQAVKGVLQTKGLSRLNLICILLLTWKGFMGPFSLGTWVALRELTFPSPKPHPEKVC